MYVFPTLKYLKPVFISVFVIIPKQYLTPSRITLVGYLRPLRWAGYTFAVGGILPCLRIRRMAGRFNEVLGRFIVLTQGGFRLAAWFPCVGANGLLEIPLFNTHGVKIKDYRSKDECFLFSSLVA
jgi:hypothetical protein